MMRRLHAALTAESDELFQTVLSTHNDILRTVLKNSNLHEDHLLALLKRRDLSEDMLKAVYQYEHKHPSRKLKIGMNYILEMRFHLCFRQIRIFFCDSSNYSFVIADGIL